MWQTGVVQKANGVGLPVEPHAELGRFDMPIKHLKDRVALVLLKADNTRRKEAVDEEAFLAGHWMGPNDRMLGPRIRLAAIIIAISSAKVFLAVMDRGKAVDQLADRLRQRLVGQIHVGKHGVAAAIGRDFLEVE